jgi:hypothetical protein
MVQVMVQFAIYDWGGEEMRAREFLNEANADKPIRSNMKVSGPYAKRYDDMDTYYDMYRLGVAIAGGENTPAEGPAGAHPTVWIMNDVEDEKIKTAERVLGKKGTVVVPKGPSEEYSDTNDLSPIASIKRNRYGV